MTLLFIEENAFLLFLLSFSLVFAQSGHYCVTGNVWCLDYFFASVLQANDTINITLTVTADSSSAKWITLGLNNVPAIPGAHTVIGWVQPVTNIQTLSCRMLVGQSNSHNPVNLPINYATSLPGAMNSGGVHVINFSRRVYFTNNNYGIPNILNAFTHAFWAVGPDAPVNANDNITQHLPTMRGTFAINFFTGQAGPDFTATTQSSSASKLGTLLLSTILMVLLLLR